MRSFIVEQLASRIVNEVLNEDDGRNQGPIRGLGPRFGEGMGDMPMRKPSIPLPGVPRIPIFPEGHPLGPEPPSRKPSPYYTPYQAPPVDDIPYDPDIDIQQPFDGDIPRYLDPDLYPRDDPNRFREKPGPYLKPEYEYIDPIPLKPYEDQDSTPGRIIEPPVFTPVYTA